MGGWVGPTDGLGTYEKRRKSLFPAVLIPAHSIINAPTEQPVKRKGTAIPLQAWTGPEGFR